MLNIIIKSNAWAHYPYPCALPSAHYKNIANQIANIILKEQ